MIYQLFIRTADYRLTPLRKCICGEGDLALLAGGGRARKT